MYCAASGLRAVAGVMRPPRTSCASMANDSSKAGLSGLPASPSAEASAFPGVVMPAAAAVAAAGVCSTAWLLELCCAAASVVADGGASMTRACFGGAELDWSGVGASRADAADLADEGCRGGVNLSQAG